MKYILMLALACAGILVLLALYSRKTPDNVGLVDGELRPCPESRNCVSSRAADAEHHVAPLAVEDDPETTADRLEAAITDMGGVVVDARSGYVRAEFASPVLGFRDDLECLWDREAEVVHVRSASRVGYYDFNMNRKRVEALRRQLAALKPAPAP